jgi:hypothetical protein
VDLNKAIGNMFSVLFDMWTSFTGIISHGLERTDANHAALSSWSERYFHPVFCKSDENSYSFSRENKLFELYQNLSALFASQMCTIQGEISTLGINALVRAVRVCIFTAVSVD